MPLSGWDTADRISVLACPNSTVRRMRSVKTISPNWAVSGKEANIPVSKLAAAAGYQPGYNVLGVNILDSQKSAAVLEAFDLTDR